MCGNRLVHKVLSAELRERLGIENNRIVMQRRSLRRFEQVQRKDDNWLHKGKVYPKLEGCNADINNSRQNTDLQELNTCQAMQLIKRGGED